MAQLFAGHAAKFDALSFRLLGFGLWRTSISSSSRTTLRGDSESESFIREVCGGCRYAGMIIGGCLGFEWAYC